MNAVANHVGGFAACRRNHPIADHQQPIIVAGGEFLEQYRLAFLASRLIGDRNLLARRKIRGYAAALVAVLGLKSPPARRSRWLLAKRPPRP